MESEYKIDIFKIMQTSTPHGRTSEDGSPAGDTIRKLIEDNWDKYEKISLYFEGIAQMTRPFIDEAFAKILESHSLDEFNAKLHFPDANASTVQALNTAVKLRLKIIKAAKEREDAERGF
ncbi:MAG: STAS-like domain-containing protein [Nitrospinaceae bacterium]